MHFVFATRGELHEVNRFCEFMNSQMFYWNRENLNVCECGQLKKDHKNKDCKFKEFKPRVEKFGVSGALRPIQLWEYIFPEEYKDEVLTSLNVDPSGKVHPILATINATLLRKAMGLKPVTFKPTEQTRFMYRGKGQCVALYPIGIKEDLKKSWEEVGYRQEML